MTNEQLRQDLMRPGWYLPKAQRHRLLDRWIDDFVDALKRVKEREEEEHADK